MTELSVYSQFIATSRYARWLPDLKRRETWEETVDRYMANVIDRYVTGDDRDKIRDAILNLEVMPSMRMLMTAGPALDRDHMAGYNPVSGDTLVLTKEHGNVPIEQLEGRTCHVLNKDGRWAVATFRGYGKQSVSKVKVRLNSNTVKEVLATSNHRWYKTDGNVVSTADLNTGDSLPFVSAPKPAEDQDYHLGVKHGLVYGDGSAIKSHGRTKGYRIRLCGDSRELIKYLAEYPVTYPPSANGDPVVQMYDSFAATHSLKELPHEETDSYKLGFLRGWFAADGSVSSNGQISICVTDEGRKWLHDYAETVGWVVQSDYEFSDRTNFGMRTRRQWSVRFSRSSLTEEDMLCSWKRVSMRSLNSHFVVASVEPAGEAYVYCAEVEDTNTFTLKGGLLTGNCSFVAMDDVRAFDEILYVLTCGTGVGFTVESRYIEQLPTVAEEFHDTDSVIVVADSRIGWATSFRELISLLYAGKVPKIDVSKVRPKGERLRTFGGRASGPEPLVDLFNYCISIFRAAAGRKLSDIEVHGIVCKIGEIVVVGGVRRSALISITDLSSVNMTTAKSGDWRRTHPEYMLANISAAYDSKPNIGVFMREWNSLYASKSGERGIYHRKGMKDKTKRIGRRDASKIVGTNPCAEIALRSCGLCNLSEVIVRPTDDELSLIEKVRLASIIGTVQSCFTNFRYVRKVWKNNAEEERLLGVSLSGVFDNPLTCAVGPELDRLLDTLKVCAVATNQEWADTIGINRSVAVTCNKPSGTVSQLADCAYGMHPRYSRWFIRSIRQDNKDPLTAMLKASGIPHEACLYNPDSITIFSFPMQAPATAMTVTDLDAIDHLEIWKAYNEHWAEHQVSITVSIEEDQWLEVGAWVYRNFDHLTGVSFLPADNGSYKQAPYQRCSEEEYNKLVQQMPVIDWSLLQQFESDDMTTGSRELACTASGCDVL